MKGLMAHRIWLGLVPLILATSVQAQVADLDAFVAAKAGALEVLHRKAERALVGVAQDSSYRDYFKAHSDHHRHELKERIDQISLEAQNKFDVGEMCLINENGHEISRIVEGEVAHDLSTEEAAAIFFKPAFALAPLKRLRVADLHVARRAPLGGRLRHPDRGGRREEGDPALRA